MPDVAELLAMARAAGATVVESPGAIVVLIPTTRASDAAELLPLDDAAKVAATTIRVVKDAIRSGALQSFGGERDRSVRRGDLDAWIASRAHRAPVAAGPNDADIERRVRRLSRRKSPGSGQHQTTVEHDQQGRA